MAIVSRIRLWTCDARVLVLRLFESGQFQQPAHLWHRHGVFHRPNAASKIIWTKTRAVAAPPPYREKMATQRRGPCGDLSEQVRRGPGILFEHGNRGSVRSGRRRLVAANWQPRSDVNRAGAGVVEEWGISPPPSAGPEETFSRKS